MVRIVSLSQIEYGVINVVGDTRDYIEDFELEQENLVVQNETWRPKKIVLGKKTTTKPLVEN